MLHIIYCIFHIRYYVLDTSCYMMYIIHSTLYTLSSDSESQVYGTFSGAHPLDETDEEKGLPIYHKVIFWKIPISYHWTRQLYKHSAIKGRPASSRSTMSIRTLHYNHAHAMHIARAHGRVALFSTSDKSKKANTMSSVTIFKASGTLSSWSLSVSVLWKYKNISKNLAI